jgi:exodeoxyribonuclease V alpha subunit
MLPISSNLSPLQRKLLELKAAAAARKPTTPPSLSTITTTTTTTTFTTTIPANITPSQGEDKHGNTITYNTAQQQAIDLISSGQSCVVIGAAGTGKTTIQKASTAALLQSGQVTPSLGASHKYLKSTSPGIAIVAYTRRATNNIRRNMSPELQDNCITIHKLLEYQPTEVWIIGDDGKERQSMRFLPARNAENPLPSTISTIIIEEASMVSLQLFEEIIAACPHKPQFVFLGDIQQLPPVFGSAILGYKMLELPVIELTEVHRQALDSPILSLAHRILSGNPITSNQLTTFNTPGKLTLHPWKKRISPNAATITLAKFFVKALDENKYDPEQDAILIPFNKSCGTNELNKHIASRIAEREHKDVYEIIHGFKKSYYSVGDKCLYDREDAIILAIEPNPQYMGASPRLASPHMNYWGHITSSPTDDGDADDFDIDAVLANVALPSAEDDATVRAASHTITLQLLDSDRTITIRSAGEVDSLILGYAITIHKAQGSEWDKVFLCFHHSHNTMIQRELLYTAVTRAKQELFCICEPDTYERGITRQRIKGNTWQEKAEYFKGKLEEGIEQS